MHFLEIVQSWAPNSVYSDTILFIYLFYLLNKIYKFAGPNILLGNRNIITLLFFLNYSIWLNTDLILIDIEKISVNKTL